MPSLIHFCVLSFHSALATETPPCRPTPPRPAKTTEEARLEPEISRAALAPASRRARALRQSRMRAAANHLPQRMLARALRFAGPDLTLAPRYLLLFLRAGLPWVPLPGCPDWF